MVAWLLLGLRVALATVFAVSGAAKLAAPRLTRMTVLDFGVSRALAPAVAVCVPALELAVASSLLVQPWARWGAIGALVLLTGFSVAVVVNMRQGKSPDCHCFGQLGVVRSACRRWYVTAPSVRPAH